MGSVSMGNVYVWQISLAVTAVKVRHGKFKQMCTFFNGKHNVLFLMFTGVKKDNKLSSDSSIVKQETSSREQSKANNTIIHRKDKEERHQDQARGERFPQKDLPLYQNVTQSTEKKSNGTLKNFIKSPKGTKESFSNVTSTESEKKLSQVSDMKYLKGGASVIQKVQKDANATEEFKVKDKIQHKGQEKKVMEKHLNVTTSIEKDKKPFKESGTLFKEGHLEKKTAGKHLNVTTSSGKERKASKDSVMLLKEGSTEKKLLGKLSGVTSSVDKDKKLSQGNITQPKEGSAEKKSNVTSSIEKDKKVGQSNNLPKIGSLGKRKVDKLLNVTAASSKDKKLPEDDERTANKKVTSGNKKGETHISVTVSTEKDRKLNQGNVTPGKEASLGKTNVDKHLNVSNSTEKDKRNQSKVTPLKEKTSELRNFTISSEKRRKLVPGNETKILPLGKKTAQRQVNVTSATGKDSKLQQGKATRLKVESSIKTKLDSHVGTSTEKEKKFQQSNETKVLSDVTAEKKRAQKLNVTTVTVKDKKLYKSNSTLIKDWSSQKGKVDNLNVKKASEKGKKFLQGDETAVLTKVRSVTEDKGINATTTSEKDHGHREDASQKNKVNSDLVKTHLERTTKLIDVGPVEVHNITATGFVITWEAPQGVFRNFTVTRREAGSGRSHEDEAEEAEKGRSHDIKTDEIYSSNRTSSKIYMGKSEGKNAERFSQILAGSSRSYHFKNLRPQTKYSVSLFSSGLHVRSKVHRLFVSTGK